MSSVDMCMRVMDYRQAYRMALLKTRRTSRAKAAVSWYHSAWLVCACVSWLLGRGLKMGGWLGDEREMGHVKCTRHPPGGGT